MNTETQETNMNGYFQKQTWNEYSAKMDKKLMIIGIKRPPESTAKLKEVK
jgi:hypothetical protein